MGRLPAGEVTLLFTDIEGSTRLLRELRDHYADALKDHRRLLRGFFMEHNGVEVDSQGDAFFVAFERAADALGAAHGAQRALVASKLRVRMGIHTGKPMLTDEGYVGIDVHRGARICAAGHGGQVLLSRTTREALGSGVDVRDLGEHRLKDLAEPEWLFQLVAPDLDQDFPPLRSLSNTNLPAEASSLVGRDREVAELGDMLSRANVRLLTLTGVGGAGKTRLALRLATEAVGNFKNGVFWISLAAVTDPRLVLPTVAQTLGFKETAGETPNETLARNLEGKSTLLVLDNFEQVLAAAPDVGRLLAATTQLKVVVTSRERLRLSGESEYVILPLAGEEAIALFLERAHATLPDFAIDGNRSTVAAICERLDRLPLALELAAPRLKLLSPEAMLTHLDRRLAPLGGGARDLPARQQTLRATIDWSYSLLVPDERRLFCTLAVFVGGCTLEAAQTVCETGFDVLGSLLDKSLLRREEERYLMLETIREYALERLDSDPLTAALRRRHAEHFLALVERTPPHSSDSLLGMWFDRLEPDDANVRAAAEWAIETGEAQMAFKLVNAAYPFWIRRGHWTWGIQLTRAVLALPSAIAATLERGDALMALGHMALSEGNFPEARAATEEGVGIYRALGDNGRLAGGLSLLAGIDYESGDHARAVAVIEEALTLTPSQDEFRIDELWNNLGTNLAFSGDLERGRTLLEAAVRRRSGTPRGASTLHMLGVIEQMRGDYGRSAALLTQAISSLDPKFDVSLAPKVLISLALTEACRGDLAKAAALCAQGLDGARELGDQVRIARGLDTMAIICAELGQDEHAARLFGAADALNPKIGAAVWVPIRQHIEPARELARQRLGSSIFDRAREEGRSVTLKDAISEALDCGGTRSA